jgi:hypothetical protein
VLLISRNEQPSWIPDMRIVNRNLKPPSSHSAIHRIGALGEGSGLSTLPRLAAFLVVGLIVIEVLLVNVPSFNIGVAIFPRDIGVLLLLSGTLFQVQRLQGRHPLILLLLAFTALITLSLLRGVVVYGVQTAVNEARSFIYFTVALLFFSTASGTSESSSIRRSPIFLCAIVLLLVALFRWTATLLGLSVAQQWADVVYTKPMRVLNAAQTLFLAEVGILLLAAQFTGAQTVPGRRLLLASLVGVLILQHRSVWIAAIIGAMLITWQGGKNKIHIWVFVAIAAVLIVSLLTLLLPSQAAPLLEAFQESVTEVSSEQSTWNWRTEGWFDLVQNSGSTGLEWAVGKPFGSGYSRSINGQEVEVSPHNCYLQAFLRTGVAGLLALAAISIGACVGVTRLIRQTAGIERTKVLAMAGVCGMQLAYFIAYGPNMEQGMFLGISVQMAISRRGNGFAPMRRAIRN